MQRRSSNSLQHLKIISVWAIRSSQGFPGWSENLRRWFSGSLGLTDIADTRRDEGWGPLRPDPSRSLVICPRDLGKSISPWGSGQQGQGCHHPWWPSLEGPAWCVELLREGRCGPSSRPGSSLALLPPCPPSRGAGTPRMAHNKAPCGGRPRRSLLLFLLFTPNKQPATKRDRRLCCALSGRHFSLRLVRGLSGPRGPRGALAHSTRPCGQCYC